jgi:hypothetical protein
MYLNLRLTNFQTLSLANNFRNEANQNYLFEHSFANQVRPANNSSSGFCLPE